MNSEITEDAVGYKDPKNLRDLSLERLKFEGNRLAHQFTEWNNFFDILSAIRVKGALTPVDYSANPNQFSEVERWSIYSNRFLIMDRGHLSDYKLFTKDEVLKMIRSAYIQGWQDRRYSEEENMNQWECEKKYMEKQEKI